jgi:mono/diheme cytochrome c family protein
MKVRSRLLPVLMVLPVLAGCGGTDFEGIASDDPLYEGAQIFNERCAGCHSYDAAAAEGSYTTGNDTEYKDGPNFNQRKEKYEDVLYAIQNGGFSSGPMPQNIVVGEQAKVVACFVATFSGKEANQDPSPGTRTETSGQTDDCREELED